jgi:threonine synthase
MGSFEQSGSLTIDEPVVAEMRKVFAANAVTEAETVATMKLVHQKTGLLLDPHTAVGLTATRIAGPEEDVVTLATAHPAKFPDVVNLATGTKPDLPERMQWINTATERCDTLPADIAALRSYIEGKPFSH